MEIAGRKKIITDEHSGRILVDIDLAKEEEEKMEKLFNKTIIFLSNKSLSLQFIEDFFLIMKLILPKLFGLKKCT